MRTFGRTRASSSGTLARLLYTIISQLVIPLLGNERVPDKLTRACVALQFLSVAARGPPASTPVHPTHPRVPARYPIAGNDLRMNPLLADFEFG